jgi:hypothetical protein
VVIPNSVTSIGNYAFQNCSGITTLTFMDDASKLKIGNNAFKSVAPTKAYFGRQMSFAAVPCTALETVEFGENVTSIEAGAFKDGSAIRTVISHNPVPPTTEDPFNDTTYPEGELYVPALSIDAYAAADGWKNFWEIKAIDESNGIATVEADSKAEVRVENGAICVSGDTNVRIVSVSGNTIYSGCSATRVSVASGIYIVVTGNTATKVAVK